MIQYIRKNIFTVVGLIVGLAGGYLYWLYVGCASGTCPIQSSPWSMTPYGGLLGALTGNLVGDMLKKKQAGKV